MSSYKKTLPNEIWLNIFNQIDDNKQLAQCRLVCRFWKPLVEKIMYKTVDLTVTNYSVLAKLCEDLVSRPELGHLIQKICVNRRRNIGATLYKLLQFSPNLKIIDGEVDERLRDELLSKLLECSTLRLEQLPNMLVINELYLKCLLRFKQTLRSAIVNFDASTTRTDRTCLGDSLDQFKHLQHLAIKDHFCFEHLRDLDLVLRKCNQVQDLRISVYQEEDYIHTNKTELDQWLASNAQRVETIKSLEIDFMDDSLEDEEKQPHVHGPDWMDYLAYKCPNVTKLTIFCEAYNRQHIILPRFTHLEAFDLQNLKFYTVDDLKRFVDMLGTRRICVRLNVNFEIHYGDPYLCLMSATKKGQDKQTLFSIQLPCDDSIKANTISVMSLFSTRTIDLFHINLTANDNLEPICASMECNLNVERFRITTRNQLLRECPQQPIFSAALRRSRLEIIDTTFTTDFMKQLNTHAPHLIELNLVNCTFEDKVLLPSIDLNSLSIHEIERNDEYDEEFKRHTSFMLRISTGRCPEQAFLAAPNKQLQRVTEEEARLIKTSRTICIQCGSLKHLGINLTDYKFEMTFDDDTDLMKSVDCGIEDSYHYTLERNLKILEESRELMETRAKIAEEKYSRSKKYLTAIQIQAIEQDLN